MKHLLLRFLIGLGLAAPLFGVELVGTPEVQVFSDKAVVSWKTDVACGTRLSLGTSADKLDRKIEGGVTQDHTVELTGLQSGGTYHYSLGSARQRLHTGSFVTNAATPAASPGDKATPAPGKKSVLEKVLDLFTPEVKPATPAPSSPAQPRAPPTRETWGRMDTLQDHFIRHGPDFGCRNADEYAAQAWFLLQRARSGELPMKWDDADATLRLFDPQTRAFAAYNRDGTTKTFFRPQNPSYWHRQPGRPIKPANLPF